MFCCTTILHIAAFPLNYNFQTLANERIWKAVQHCLDEQVNHSDNKTVNCETTTTNNSSSSHLNE